MSCSRKPLAGNLGRRRDGVLSVCFALGRATKSTENDKIVWSRRGRTRKLALDASTGVTQCLQHDPVEGIILSSGRLGEGMRISKQVIGNATQRENQSVRAAGNTKFAKNTITFGLKISLAVAFLFSLPDVGHIDTWTCLKLQGGKRRIRILPASPERAYPHRQVAIALVLPETSRSEPSMGDGAPIIRSEQYAITHLFMQDVNLAAPDRVNIAIGELQVANNYSRETIDFGVRFEKVKRVWSSKATFDDEIRTLIERHEAMVRGGGPLGVPGEQLIRQLQRTVAAASVDYRIVGNAPVTDVLPSCWKF